MVLGVRVYFHRVKIKVSAGLAPSGGSEGRICFLAIFTLVAAYILWFVAASIFKEYHCTL